MLKGQHHSDETKRKISKTVSKNPTRYWLDKKMPKQMIKKLSKAHKQILIKSFGQNILI